MSIPALDRGLKILDELIRADEPLPYGRVRRRLEDVPDSSLNRLLKSLIASGHVIRNERGRYRISKKIAGWRRTMERRIYTLDIVRRHVEALSEEVDESAAFAILKNDRIEVVHSVTRPESIAIIGAGAILHFEADHAAALAILDALEERDVQRMIASEHGETPSLEALRKGSLKTKRNGVYADRSTARLGVSRLALGVAVDSAPGALFICLPTVRMKTRFDVLRGTLARRVATLLADMNKA